jgi:CotH kinase protein
MDPIPDRGTAKDIRSLLKSVFIPALPKDSRARQIAEAADDPSDADSFLRGKAEFDQAAKALLQLPGSAQDGKILFRDPSQGGLTQAGMVVALWQKASADRTTIFSGMGATGPTLLTVHVDGVDLNTLWKDDQFGEPLKADGNAAASVRVFETTPSLTLPKQPDADNGVIIWEHGEQVSVKRRGNTSRGDPKINVSVYLDNDDEAGIPRQLCLLNGMRDPSYQRVRLAYDLLRLAKCPVRPAIYAELTLNGFYYGTYVAMPPLDDYHFNQLLPGIKHRAIFKGNYGDLPGGAPLEMRGTHGTDYFTPNSRPESRSYEPRNDTPDSDYAALASFITAFHSQDSASPAFFDTVRKILDVEQFLRTMVVVNLLGSWDTYYLNSQNYFLHLAVDDSGNNPPFGTFALNDVDSLLGVSWPGQKRNWQDKDLLFRGTEIGKIPLITRLLANPRFLAYYLDFMEWFINQHFNVASVQAIEASRWAILEQSVYLESDTPYGPPHTNRPWTNDQVYRASVLSQMLAADQGPVAGIQVDGIDTFVNARCKKVLGQLKGMRRVSNGVDFGSDNWSLPA